MTRRRITQVELYTEELVMKNVKVAMFKEKLGLGPKYYYINLLAPLPTYYSRLVFLTGLLPSEKFIISPPGMEVLGRFFNTTQDRQLSKLKPCWGGSYPKKIYCLIADIVNPPSVSCNYPTLTVGCRPWEIFIKSRIPCQGLRERRPKMSRIVF